MWLVRRSLRAISTIYNLIFPFSSFSFLHRDIKPANFAVAKDDPRRILLFDFGLCRRYLDADKTIRRPRWSTGFRGTYRYASISVHISREMSPKDDIESWFYQQVELTVGCLPWGTEEDLDKICQMKDTARGEGEQGLFPPPVIALFPRGIKDDDF